jgi:hypothetical protein
LRPGETFRTYRFGSRDVLTVPVEPVELRAAGVRALPAATLRARAFRAVLGGLVGTRLDGLVAGRGDPAIPAGFDLSLLMSELQRALGRDDLEPAIVHPRQGDRRRFYVHLLSTKGERIAFAKVSRDVENDRQLLNEALALRALSRAGVWTFRFPALLGKGLSQGHQYILLAPLPERTRPLAPRWTPALTAIRREIAGAPKPLPSVTQASWWPLFEARGSLVPALVGALAQKPPGPVMTCTAHGDFVNWNVHRDENDLWLFDWEAYSPDAPVLVDDVRFFLGIHTRAAAVSPMHVVRLLQDRFGCSEQRRRFETTLALAFLHAHRVVAAAQVGAVWDEVIRA